MAKDRRRYSRHVATVTAQLKERGRAHDLTTADISRHGVFLITDSPKAERQLVQLSFDLPDGSLEIMGMVARTVTPGQAAAAGCKPGMGIDFFALSRSAKNRWDAFVLTPGKAPKSTGEVEKPDSTRRHHPRHVSCFLVRLKTRDRLREYYSRDISGGGTMLRTPAPSEVAPNVEMILVHPETDAEFPLNGTVVRVVEAAALDQRGVAIAFDPLDSKREGMLLAFIETGVLYLEEHSEARQEKLRRLKKATEVAPKSPLPLVALGQALLEVDQTSTAIQTFQRALAVDPDCMSAHRGLYEAYGAIEAHTRAAQHLLIIERHEAEKNRG